MKYTNLFVDGEVHLCAERDGVWLDVSAQADLGQVIRGKKIVLTGNEQIIRNTDYARLCGDGAKLVCVGLNYRAHADKVNLKRADCPILFSKFSNAQVPSGAEIELPAWETSYDYEAELVIVIGKTAWGITPEQAPEYIFGYTAGNDLSVREPQMMTSQWLIGKTMPGFGPCGPCIVSADEFNPLDGKRIRSFVNGKLQQDGSTSDMIFTCQEIVAHASKYIRLEPGDLIFTGTPSGVQLEKSEKHYLVPGDVVDVQIEGIGTLTNTMV